MKIVRVTYTTSQTYATQNKININAVMDEIQKANYEGIKYNACIADDHKTFIHTAFFKTDNDQKILGALASFQSFQTQLKNSDLEIAPKQEILSLVGSSKNIFN